MKQIRQSKATVERSMELLRLMGEMKKDRPPTERPLALRGPDGDVESLSLYMVRPFTCKAM
jgi:hypothetical protein